MSCGAKSLASSDSSPALYWKGAASRALNRQYACPMTGMSQCAYGAMICGQLHMHTSRSGLHHSLCRRTCISTAALRSRASPAASPACNGCVSQHMALPCGVRITDLPCHTGHCLRQHQHMHKADSTFHTSTRALASSQVSRAAPAAVLSPISRNPAGTVHSPRHGSIPRRHSRTLPSCSTTQPTTCNINSQNTAQCLSMYAAGRQY